MGHRGELLSPTPGKTPPYQINAFLDPDVEPEESEGKFSLFMLFYLKTFSFCFR